jgi:hypothetical protein
MPLVLELPVPVLELEFDELLALLVETPDEWW